MIWIVGGTSETRELLDLIEDRCNDMKNIRIIITVATEEGKKQIEMNRNDKLCNYEIAVIRMGTLEMEQFIEENQIKTVVDLSHPYAVEVSKNAREAASNKGCKYIRFVREEADTEDTVILKDTDEARNYLSEVDGTVFFTTGSKDIPVFESERKNNRFIYRILPAEQGIRICKDNDIDLKDIVGIMGPFSKEFNTAMFRNYEADYVVMKNSGKSGGTLEKIEACKELGIKALLIGRPEDNGIRSLREIVELIE